MPDLPLDPSSSVLAILAVVSLLLYLREYNRRRKLQSESDSFLQEIKQKGWETLNQSIKKSQAILGQAELDSIKVVEGNKQETAKLNEYLETKFAESLEESRQHIIATQNQFLQFMQSLQKRSEEFEEASKTAGEQRIKQLFDRVESRLSEFLVQTEQNTTSAIELELKTTRQFIDTYKTRQLKLIDENIIAMMEQTLSLVLGKKLSLKDQLDLVYEALEKAKVEKFIV